MTGDHTDDVGETDELADVVDAIVETFTSRRWTTEPAATGYALLQPVDVRAAARAIAGTLAARGHINTDRPTGG